MIVKPVAKIQSSLGLKWLEFLKEVTQNLIKQVLFHPELTQRLQFHSTCIYAKFDRYPEEMKPNNDFSFSFKKVKKNAFACLKKLNFVPGIEGILFVLPSSHLNFRRQ